MESFRRKVEGLGASELRGGPLGRDRGAVDILSHDWLRLEGRSHADGLLLPLELLPLNLCLGGTTADIGPEVEGDSNGLAILLGGGEVEGLLG